MINFNVRLPELGRIKIGCFGDEYERNGKKYRKLIKWDYIKVTHNFKDPNDHCQKTNWAIDDQMTQAVAIKNGSDDPLKPTRIGPCYLPFDTIEANFFTTFARYTATKTLCMGNGNVAHQLKINSVKEGETEEIDCIPGACPFYEKGECRPSGVLSVIFPQSKHFGGVYTFRTKSKNSIESILSQMVLYLSQKGSLCGIPFELVLNEKRVKDRTGTFRNIKFVTLQYAGTYEEFQALPAREAPKQLDVTDSILKEQRALIKRSEKLSEDPEDFCDEPEEYLNPESDYETPQESEANTPSAPESDPAPAKQRMYPPEEKEEHDPDDPDLIDEPEVPNQQELQKQKEKEEDEKPLNKSLFEKFDWIINPDFVVPVLDTVNKVIASHGRKITDESLGKYGVTCTQLFKISEENVTALLDKVGIKYEPIEKEDDGPNIDNKLIAKLKKALTAYIKEYNPDAGEQEQDYNKTVIFEQHLNKEFKDLNDAINNIPTDDICNEMIDLVKDKTKTVKEHNKQIKEAEEAESDDGLL